MHWRRPEERERERERKEREREREKKRRRGEKRSSECKHICRKTISYIYIGQTCNVYIYLNDKSEKNLVDER